MRHVKLILLGLPLLVLTAIIGIALAYLANTLPWLAFLALMVPASIAVAYAIGSDIAAMVETKASYERWGDR